MQPSTSLSKKLKDSRKGTTKLKKMLKDRGIDEKNLNDESTIQDLLDTVVSAIHGKPVKVKAK